MTWDLSKLYAGFDAPEFTADLEAAKALADRLFHDVKAMDLTVESLEGAIGDFKALMALSLKTMGFTQLTLAADANCAPAMAAFAKLQPILNRNSEVYSALSMRLKDQDLEPLTASSDLLREHANLLKVLKRDAAHVIDPALEPVVLKMQMTGGSAWARLRDQLDGLHRHLHPCEGLLSGLPDVL